MREPGRTRAMVCWKFSHSHEPQKSSQNRNPPRSRYSRSPVASASLRSQWPTSTAYTNGYLKISGSVKAIVFSESATLMLVKRLMPRMNCRSAFGQSVCQLL